MLSKSLLIPLIRYNSKDSGMIFSYHKMKGILEKNNYGHLCPELNLPLVAVGGRKGRCVTIKGASVYPEEIKQCLYSDFRLAESMTGQFKLKSELDCVLIEIQLRQGLEIPLSYFLPLKRFYPPIAKTLK